MKKSPTHVMRLQVSRSGALVRLISRARDMARARELHSYTVIVNFDASSGSLSAWLTGLDEDATAGALPLGEHALTLPSPLSTREAEVLGHLAHGESDKEIARSMEISIGTVKVHVRTIIRKLGVANRTQAAILVLGGHRFSDGQDSTHPALFDAEADERSR